MTTASHTGDSSVVRASVAKFRLAWALGQQPRIDDFLPPTAAEASLDLRRELLAALVAVDLEQRWQTGEQEFSSASTTQDYAGPESFAGDNPQSIPLVEDGKRHPLSAYLESYPELESAELPLELLEVAFRCVRAQRANLSIDEFVRDYDLSPGRQVALLRRLNRLGTATTSSGAADSRTLSFIAAGNAQAAVKPGFERMKLSFGPYKVIGLVGSGGYGSVFLGHDERLDRLVAIKVAHAGKDDQDSDQEKELHRSFIDEARRIAQLNHPHIVKVLDVDRSETYAWYLVMEYVDGPSFKDAMASGKMLRERIAAIIAQVARAVHHAHKHNIFHRDLKPSNILLSAAEWPYVVDFGMALHVRDQRSQAGRIMGTPAYMSPEQVRGESHRLDGRTDVWSLGVTLYEALAGQRPFGGDDPEDLFDEILHKEPRPLRQLVDDVPPELERICLRCLAKRMKDRYSSAADLATDLELWLDSLNKSSTVGLTATPAGSGQGAFVAPPAELPPVCIVPRGLRSFSERDADFFVELLPGPHARDGLPESIHRWRAAIETPDSPSHAVCVLYGPSGSGKSSIVRAGILPRLSKQIRCVVVDAGTGDVEGNLLAALARLEPDLPHGSRLHDACAWLRRRLSGGAGKVLLVIDQFEHWLHTHAGDAESLVAALRHCDGVSLQCLITVRSDFWLGATRFMEQLEVPLVDDVNCGRIDLFPQRHARKVLQYFGEAYGCLPPRCESLSAEQEEFLDKAIAQIADDGWVVPVRLALLAEMMKSRQWKPETLRTLGGERGLGIQFLEQTFDSALASPVHRRYRRPVEAILAELLPDEGVEIKGQSHSRDELLRAAGLTDNEDQFAAAIDVLDRQLRLITPIEQEALAGVGAADANSAENPKPNSPAYQLTHDYLVPAIREWVSRRQQQTRAGRAQLCLERRTRQWAPTREVRYLPSLAESLRIGALTKRSAWAPEQRAMMRRALGWHAMVLAGAASLAVALALVVFRRAESRLSAFLDSERPAEERIAALDRVSDPTPEEVEAAVGQLEVEQVDEVVTIGAEWLTRILEESARSDERLPTDALERMCQLAARRLGDAGGVSEGLGVDGQAAMYSLLASLSRTRDPRVVEQIAHLLNGLSLPEDSDVRRSAVASLFRLKRPDIPDAVRRAATAPFVGLTAEQLLSLLVAYSRDATDEAETALSDHLGALSASNARRRSGELIDTIRLNLAQTAAMTDEELLISPVETTFLLTSLPTLRPFLAIRPDPVIKQLGALLRRRNGLRGTSIVELACIALANLHRTPSGSEPPTNDGDVALLHEIFNDYREVNSVRATAAEALGIVGDAAAVKSLTPKAGVFGNATVQWAALEALAAVGDERVRLGRDARDVFAAFQPLFQHEAFDENDSRILDMLIGTVQLYSRFAPPSEFPAVLPAAIKLRPLRGEGVILWNTYSAFLVRWPEEARTLTETYFQALLKLPDDVVPLHRETLAMLLRMPPDNYSAEEIHLAVAQAMTAASQIAAEHPDDDLGELARENLSAAQLELNQGAGR